MKESVKLSRGEVKVDYCGASSSSYSGAWCRRGLAAHFISATASWRVGQEKELFWGLAKLPDLHLERRELSGICHPSGREDRGRDNPQLHTPSSPSHT